MEESFVRFPWRDRLLHIALMVSFVVLAATGLPQKFSTLEWARSAVELMGGIGAVRLVHRISAIVLGGALIYHVVRGLYGLLVKRNRFDMLPKGKDFVDFFQNIRFMLGLRGERPRFERFSYVEKFDYWAVFWGMGVMATSGLILWFPTLSTRFLPGLSVPMAKAAHSDEALLAVSAIVLWHLYNTHLKPRMFPFNASIFTGRLSRHEMMIEHAAEFERITGEKVPDELLQERAPMSWATLATSAVLGLATVTLFVAMISWAIRPPNPPTREPLHLPIAQRELLLPAPTPLPTPAGSNGARIWTSAGVKAPMADFRAEPLAAGGQLGAAPFGAFQFTDLSGGEVATYLWDFGDGGTSNERHPQHTYVQCPGSLCSVTLTVCGPGGCAVETKGDYILVTPS